MVRTVAISNKRPGRDEGGRKVFAYEIRRTTTRGDEAWYRSEPLTWTAARGYVEALERRGETVRVVSLDE